MPDMNASVSANVIDIDRTIKNKDCILILGRYCDDYPAIPPEKNLARADYIWQTHFGFDHVLTLRCVGPSRFDHDFDQTEYQITCKQPNNWEGAATSDDYPTCLYSIQLLIQTFDHLI